MRWARFNADLQRDAARASVVSSFSQLKTAIGSIAAGRVAARAAEVASKGVRDEAQWGQGTTLDVPNAQQALRNARVDLVTAQRDRIVIAFAALAAVGRLSAERLPLETTIYNPAPHL